MFNPFRPPSAPPDFGKGKVLPENRASLLSRITFHWLSPFLAVGFSRPLEKDDLWELPAERLTDNLTDELEASFYRRCPPQQRPLSHVNEYRASRTSKDSSSVSSGTRDSDVAQDTASKQQDRHDSSLGKAILHTFRWSFVTSGVLRLFADTLNTTTPLVSKVLLTWLQQSYVYYRSDEEARASIPRPRGIGYGIGLAFAIFAMQGANLQPAAEKTSLARIAYRQHIQKIPSSFRAFKSGAHSRKDYNYDLDRCFEIGQVLVFGLPVQFFLVRIFFRQRKKGVQITDSRVLQGVRLIKAYAWEEFFTTMVGNLRKREIKTIRVSAIARSALVGFVVFVPTLASVLSFVTYALIGHDLNVAVIFSSLQLFNIIRQPLFIVPVIMTAFSDALVALRRIGSFLTAEELDEPYEVDAKTSYAIQVDGDFTWETVSKPDGNGRPKNPRENPGLKKSAKPEDPSNEKADSSSPKPLQEDKPFGLQNLSFSVRKGSFVAVVGRVGSGKSSILQALVGEMRRERGNVTYGGSVAYVPQSPWIRNTTLKQNVLFGQQEDEARFQEIIRACSLEQDLD
ncbi:hypothetical protein V5O48_017054, partial [Marasmius crinis-equi]